MTLTNPTLSCTFWLRNFIRGCLPYQNKVIERWFSHKVWEWWIWCETQEGWNACRFCALENVTLILRYWFQMIGVTICHRSKHVLLCKWNHVWGTTLAYLGLTFFVSIQVELCVLKRLGITYLRIDGQTDVQARNERVQKFQTEQHYSRWIYWVFAPFFFVYFGFLHPTQEESHKISFSSPFKNQAACSWPPKWVAMAWIWPQLIASLFWILHGILL